MRIGHRTVPAVVAAFALLVSCGGSEAKPPPKTAASEGEGEPSGNKLTLPGDCVDPVADGDHRDPTRPFDKHVQTDVHDEDLDGDGVVDGFVKPGWSCGFSCNRSVYVMRGTCGHYVGTFPSNDKYEGLETKTNGLRDISTRPSKTEDDGQVHCYQTILKFDGKEYKPAKSRECECKDEGAKCAAWDG